MYRNHTVGVVIPAYNEAGFVGDVVETIPDYVDRVYVVDDGSTDDTWAEITAAAERVNGEQTGPALDSREFDRRVVPIRHEENRGVGGAIKTGYLRAREDRIDVTAVMGGDGQMRPSHLQHLLDPVVDGAADYAKANRLATDETAADMPRFRLLGNRILTSLTKIASGYWGIEDPQNGFTAISLAALDAIDVEDMYEFYGYCNDLLVTLSIHGFRIADVPRECIYADEQSHISYGTYVPRVSFMLLRNFLWRLHRQYLRGAYHPAGSLYVAGLLTGALGVVLAVVDAATSDRGESAAGTAVRTAVDGGVLFVLATLLERHRHADRNTTVGTAENDTGSPESESDTTDESDRGVGAEAELEAE